MRIGLDTNTVLSSAHGAKHHVLALVEELVRQADDEDELVVFHLDDEPTATLALLLRNEKLKNISTPFRGRRSSGWWRNLAFPAVERLADPGDLAELTLDICHSLRPPLMPSQAPHRVLTIQSLEVGDDVKLPLAMRRPLYQANRIVLTSNGLREELLVQLERSAAARVDEVAEKIRVIRPGVHPRFFAKPRSSTVVALCDRFPFLGEPYIVVLGGLAPVELNVPLLVDAWRRAHEQCDDLPPLVIVTHPSESRQVAGMLDEQSPGGPVFLTDNLEAEMLPALYRGARFLLYPAADHAFGLPVLEAGALGVPSIVGPGCGATEVIPEITCASRPDAESWADAICQLHLDDDRRRSLGLSALERAGSARWDVAAQQHWEIYREMVKA